MRAVWAGHRHAVQHRSPQYHSSGRLETYPNTCGGPGKDRWSFDSAPRELRSDAECTVNKEASGTKSVKLAVQVVDADKHRGDPASRVVLQPELFDLGTCRARDVADAHRIADEAARLASVDLQEIDEGAGAGPLERRPVGT